MGPKRFYSQNFSLFIVKFQKLGFIAPLRVYFASLYCMHQLCFNTAITVRFCSIFSQTMRDYLIKQLLTLENTNNLLYQKGSDANGSPPL